MPLHLLRFHFSGLVIYLMELASLVRKANILESKYNWTDQVTTSGGCTCHSDHFPWAIWKISGKFLYLPSEGGVERALEHELGNLGHSQSFDLKSCVTVGWSLSSLGLIFLVFKEREGGTKLPLKVFPILKSAFIHLINIQSRLTLSSAVYRHHGGYRGADKNGSVLSRLETNGRTDLGSKASQKRVC